jgi:hypothetical protein
VAKTYLEIPNFKPFTDLWDFAFGLCRWVLKLISTKIKTLPYRQGSVFG